MILDDDVTPMKYLILEDIKSREFEISRLRRPLSYS